MDQIVPIESHREPWNRGKLVLGDHKLESTVRYLGIEVDDALEWLRKLKSESGSGR